MPTNPNPFLRSSFDAVANQPVEVPPLELPEPVAEAPAAPVPAAAGIQRAAPKLDNLAPPDALRAVFEGSAKAFDVPVNVLMALAHQESRYDPSAVNGESGAKGIGQYMDATAKSLGIDAHNPNEAIPAMAKQIRERMDKGASMMDAVKEHFAGPDRAGWKGKTAVYGDEVMAKADAIGKLLYGEPAADKAQEPEKQNSFSAKMPRADYYANFVALNPQATPDAIQAVMAQYDVDAAKAAKAGGSKVQDRFATMNSPESAFNAKLNAKLQGDNEGLAQVLPGNAQPANPVAQTIAREKPGIGAQAKGDFGRGIDNLKALGYGAGALIDDATGKDAEADALLGKYVALQNDIAKNNPATIGTYKNVKSMGDAGRYAIEAVMENLPMMLPSLVSGGLGAQAAKVAAQRLVVGMVEKQVAGGVARGVAEQQAAKFVARTIMGGSALGAAPATIGMESGSIMGDIYQDTGKKAAGTALAFGIPAGLLDTLEPVMALRKIAGPLVDEVAGGIMRRLGVEAGKQFITEAGTEGLQTVLEEAAKVTQNGKKLLTHELLDSVIDSALKGGIGGAGIGMASQGVHEARSAVAQAVNSPARQVANEINRQVGEVNFVGTDAAARAAQDPNNMAIDPQQTVLPPDVRSARENNAATLARAGAAAPPAGPLEAAVHAAAPASPAPAGDTFTIPNDDGSVSTFQAGADGALVPVESAPAAQVEAAAPAGPLADALHGAAASHAAAPIAAPEMPQAPAAPAEPPPIESVHMDELRARLKASTAAIKVNRTAELVAERNLVQKEINTRAKEAAQETAKLAEEPTSTGPFATIEEANKMAPRVAEKAAVVHEAVKRDGKFYLQPVKEDGNGTTETPAVHEGRTDGNGSGAAAVRPGPADRDRPAKPRPVPVVDGAAAARDAGKNEPGDVRPERGADGKPALKEWEANPYHARQFASAELAAAFMEKNKVDPAAFEVQPHGKAQFKIKPKEAAPVEASVNTPAVPAPKVAEKPALTFKTAKGSTYTVNSDGTTTRDKAARAEHPGEQGIQPASQRTVYVTAEDAQKLGEIQTKGSKKGLAFDDKAGQMGVRYLDGKDAGKLERRTVVPFKTEPAVGLTPVEHFGDDKTVHFGNEITEIGGATSAKVPEVAPDAPAGLTPEAKPALSPREQAIADLADKAPKELRDIAANHKRTYMREAAANLIAERAEEVSAKRSQAMKQRMKRDSKIDTDTDHMAQAIAKMGGINRDSAKGRMRLAPEELAVKANVGNLARNVFVKNGGMTMDAAGAAMAELGYVSTDEHGKHDQSEWEDALAQVAGGEQVYTAEGMVRQAEAQRAMEMEELQAKSEAEMVEIEHLADDLEGWAEDHGIALPETEALYHDEHDQPLISEEDIHAHFEEGPAQDAGRQDQNDTEGQARAGAETGADAPAEGDFLQSQSADDLKAKAARAGDQAIADKGLADSQVGAFSLSAPPGSVEGEANAMSNSRQENFFDIADPKSKKKAEPERDLIIAHNLTEDNLLHAHKMGGIAVPSLAVTRKGQSLSGFGDITMIGSKALADPKGYAKTQVFGADIYSPRYPSVEHHIPPKELKAARLKMADAEQLVGNALDWQDITRNGLREIESAPAIMATFLQSKGITPTIVHEAPVDTGRVDKLKADGFGPYFGKRDHFDMMHDPVFRDLAVKAQIAEYKSVKKDEAFKRLIKDLETNEDAQYRLAGDRGREIVRLSAMMGRPAQVDKFKTRDAIYKQVEQAGLQKEFKAYARQFLSNLNADEKIFKGFSNSGNRTYTPHTLDNVIKILKKELRGGENFNYGVGSLRAKFTPQFKTITDIRANKDRLVSKEQFEQVKKEIDTEFFAVGNALGENLNMDAVVAILEDAPKMGLDRAAAQFIKEPLTPAVKLKVAEFLTRLHHLPTEYFEAKITREVGLHEFSGAVIHKDTSQETRDVLKQNGVPMKEYASEAERQQAVSDFADELDQSKGDVLFDIPSDRTIEVDGVRRPIENSRGQLVAQDAEGQKAFWKWFKESKAVDADGKPLVMYHGGDFNAERDGSFDPAKDTFNEGFFFTPNRERALRYANGDESKVTAVYLSVQNPDGWIGDKTRLAKEGKDGVRDGTTGAWAVFNPEQIKSATGNAGTFDPANPSIVHDVGTEQTRALMSDGPLSRMEEPKRVMVLAELKRLQRLQAAGKMTAEAYRVKVDALIGKIGERNAAQENAKAVDKERGADWVEERLMRAKRQGELDAATVDFALWALRKSPALAADLAISIRTSQNGTAGSYGSAERIMSLFKGAANEGTAVHEMLHHTERMMPAAIQQGIVKAWIKAYSAAWTRADAPTRLLLEDLMQAGLGDQAAFKRTVEAFGKGKLDYDAHYQLVNASEYWAVNATRIMAGRFDGATKGWGAKAKQWLTEMVQHVKGLLRMQSDAPILKALAEVLNGDGKRVSNKMLGQLPVANQIAFHGTPHKFDKFTTDHIGNGEGNQAFGYGLYFAGNKEIAEYYRTALTGLEDQYGDAADMGELSPAASKFINEQLAYGSEPKAIVDEATRSAAQAALWDEQDVRDGQKPTRTGYVESMKEVAGFMKGMKRSTGQLYQVDIPERAEMIQWDKPLTEQPANVKAALRKVFAEHVEWTSFDDYAKQSGADYSEMKDNVLTDMSEREVSEAMAQQGIKGIAYLDGVSRGRGDGDYNYVIFDDKAIQIIDTMYDITAGTIPAADEAADPDGLTPPPQGFLRKTQAALQDNLNRLKQVQETIEKVSGVPMKREADYYGAEMNRPGRIAARLEDAQDQITGPLMERLAKSKYTPSQLNDLLHAMHASERNEKVASINPEFPDAGSGMTDEAANVILERHKADTELHAMANQARAMAAATLDMKLAYGLITADQHEMLSDMYDHYVPLKGDGEYGPKIKRAMGHGERDEFIMENIARDYAQAVVVGEKNLARQSLLQMVLRHPDEALWTARVPPKGRYVAGTVMMIKKGDTTVAAFTAKSQVSAFLEAKGAEAGQYTVETSAGEQVVEFTKPLQDNEVMVYVKGMPVRLQIHDEKLASQLRPLDVGQMNAVGEFARGVNRHLSKVYTGYNPSFILRNTARDAMTGTINMVGNQGAEIAAKAWLKYPQAVLAMGRWAATKKIPGGQTGVYLDEYRQHGGKVGASWLSDLEQQGKSLTEMYDHASGLLATMRETGLGRRTATVAWNKTIGKLAHVIEVANAATENGLRLALFMALREAGHPPGLAAQAAKGVTVDFDRKGTATPALGAAYLFLNPAIQGTANAGKTLFKGEHKYQAWGLLGGLASLGYLLAAAGMDDDKDRWLGEGWETRSKNLMIRAGEHQVKIPVSQEFAPFFAFGTAVAEARRGESAAHSTARVLSSFFDAYFPLQVWRDGSDNHLADAGMGIIPTVLKPIAEIAANRNSFGSDLMPETEFTKDRPDNLKMNRGTKGTMFDKAAQGIASASVAAGISRPYENDITKVSPETLKMLWRTYTGGLGTFIADSAGAAAMMGDDPKQMESSDIPFVKDFYRPLDSKPLAGRYYELARDAKRVDTEYKQAAKKGDSDAIDQLQATADWEKYGAMSKVVTYFAKRSGELGDEAVDINADKTLSNTQKRAELKRIDLEKAELYRDGIDKFKKE